MPKFKKGSIEWYNYMAKRLKSELYQAKVISFELGVDHMMFMEKDFFRHSRYGISPAMYYITRYLSHFRKFNPK